QKVAEQEARQQVGFIDRWKYKLPVRRKGRVVGRDILNVGVGRAVVVPFFQERHLPGQFLWMPVVVRIQKGNVLALGVSDTRVTRDRALLILLVDVAYPVAKRG